MYGAYGYTGSLIAEMSLKQGLKPVLGGRNKEQLIRQANALNLEYRVFDLEQVKLTKNILQEFKAVIHCAGPFINTFKKMAKACIAAQTHYIDITGEVRNSSGKKMATLLTTPNGYELTSLTTLVIISKIFTGNAPAGFQTPSTAFTKDLIIEIPGVTRVDLID